MGLTAFLFFLLLRLRGGIDFGHWGFVACSISAALHSARAGRQEGGACVALWQLLAERIRNLTQRFHPARRPSALFMSDISIGVVPPSNSSISSSPPPSPISFNSLLEPPDATSLLSPWEWTGGVESRPHDFRTPEQGHVVQNWVDSLLMEPARHLLQLFCAVGSLI